VVFVGLYVWTAYNGLVTKNEAVDKQWAQVETSYQRRFDLIPSLVASVQGIFKQEQAVFGAIAEARTRYAGAITVDEKIAATAQVESALARLLAIVESYPSLNSSQSIRNLMTQLEGTENRINVERQRFNDAVNAFNLSIKRFPNNMLASSFGFHERTYFQATIGAEKAPDVKF